jgi:hypothetical protein
MFCVYTALTGLAAEGYKHGALPGARHLCKSLFLFRMQSRVCFNHSVGCTCGDAHQPGRKESVPMPELSGGFRAFLGMMDDADRLRNRATRLLALAIVSRQGQIEHSDQLTQLASEILVHAEEMERRLSPKEA